MKKVKTILILLTCYSATSCDVMRSFAVYNVTGVEKRIEVVGNPWDSVRLSQRRAQDGKWQYVKSIAVDKAKDSLPRYTFVLGSGQRAMLELGFGLRPITSQVIIDKTDTVIVRKSKGRVKKKPFFAIGGDYSLTIKK